MEANPNGVLRVADRRRLEQRARRWRADRALLLTAMRQAQINGASLREIAEIVEMSHTGVAKWLREADEPS